MRKFFQWLRFELSWLSESAGFYWNIVCVGLILCEFPILAPVGYIILFSTFVCVPFLLLFYGVRALLRWIYRSISDALSPHND